MIEHNPKKTRVDELLLMDKVIDVVTAGVRLVDRLFRYIPPTTIDRVTTAIRNQPKIPSRKND